MFVACGMWCVADVSSVSASSEQTRKCSWFEFERKTTYGEFFSQYLGLRRQQLEIFGKNIFFCILKKRLFRRLAVVVKIQTVMFCSLCTVTV